MGVLSVFRAAYNPLLNIHYGGRTTLVFAKMTEQTLIQLENKDEKNNKSAFLKVKERFSIRSKSKNKNSTDIRDTTENNKDSNGKNPETVAEDGKETTNKEKITEPEVSDDHKKQK